MTEPADPRPASPPASYSIGALADAAGVSRRTVRFYVQKGLIDPPAGRGRGAVYSAGHLEQIHAVRRLQREGLDLQTIRDLPSDATPSTASLGPTATVGPTLVVRLPLAPGLRLEVDAPNGRVPDRAVLDALRAACAQVLERAEASEGDAPNSTDSDPPPDTASE